MGRARKTVRPGLGVLAIVGALLLAGGVAYATIPDGNGVIHGCYNTNPARGPLGALRVVDTGQGQTCGTGESTLAWSQTGPRGATGPQGPQGQQGPVGPSDVWSADGYGSNKGIYLQETLTTLTVPAGKYIVEGEAAMTDSNSGTGTSFLCYLMDASNTYGQAIGSTSNSDAYDDKTEVPIQAVVTLASQDTLSLQCRGSDPFAEAHDWKLEATAVGAVH